MKVTAGMLLVLSLSACSNQNLELSKSHYPALTAFQENKHKLPGSPSLNTEAQFHSVLFQEIPEISRTHRIRSSKYPRSTYLIGVEKFGYTVNKGRKAYASISGHFSLARTCDGGKVQSENQNLCDEYESLTNDPKPAVLTHIVRFSDDSVNPIYNAYTDPAQCAKTKYSGVSCLQLGIEALTHETGFKESLQETISREKPTHIIVMATGWNTYQSESIDNYNEWIDSIETSAGDALGASFRPLYIGISWESTWGMFYDLGLGFLSQPNKSNDADEVGLVTANILINETIKPVIHGNNISLVMIGHSFGTRIVNHAAISWPLIPASPHNQPVDTVIGLQGAFSYRRYFQADKDGKEGTPYSDFRSGANLVVMTNSQYDEAVKSAGLWTTYIGDSAVRDLNDTRSRSVFRHEALLSNSELIIPKLEKPSNKVILVNADSMIRRQKEGTGGGAHSDVFNQDVGKFIWRLISRQRN